MTMENYIYNLMAIFIDIDDKFTPSLLIDGKPFKSYNSKFNRLMAKLSEAKSKSGSKYPAKCTEKSRKIGKFISFLYLKRNRFFHDQFHKLAKHVVEFLYLHGFTDLFISKNLAELKNNGKCNLNKAIKQNFIQTLFMKLIKNIEYKAQEYGIQVHYVDERYTSKASCISDDIKSIQESPDLTNTNSAGYLKTCGIVGWVSLCRLSVQRHRSLTS
jgi:IS605 OrfB family transposase